jgi:exopolyphosphatase/guanosine-5'-triphosphate,3'-diphosphate pyrophosphatase
MRTAVVDIGTNSTRLLIAELDGGKVTGELHRDSIVTRLGDGVDRARHLHPASIARVHAVLDTYAAAIERLGADRRIAVMTSAVRDASNGDEFASAIAERYRLEAHVIAGEEEARLTYLGATSERDAGDRTPTLLIDIGGGSTELVIGHGHELDFRVSTQAGVVRQTERHLHDDPPTPEQIRQLELDVDEIVAHAVPAEQRTRVRHALAVAGTATSLAAIDQRLDPYDPEKVHGYVLTSEECRRLRDRIARMTLEQRQALSGLDPARAPTIIAGVLILGRLLELFEVPAVEVSEHDILRGAALAYS